MLEKENFLNLLWSDLQKQQPDVVGHTPAIPALRR